MKQIRKYNRKTKEIGEILGVSSQTVRRWAGRGEIPHIKISAQCLRFNLDEVADWMEQRRQKGRI